MKNTCEVQNKPKSFKEFIKSKRTLTTAAGILIGGIGGFMYYHFYGCASGTCAITSSPYASVLWGGFFGFFVTNRPCSSC